MNASAKFEPDPDWPTIVELAIERWGPANKQLSKPDDIRFGTNGSKSVKPSNNTFFDHEEKTGGGYLEMYRATRGEMPKRNGAGGNIIVIYDYRDLESKLLFQVVRQPGHKFRQRRPNGSGGWIWDLKGVPRVLYRLPELAAADHTALVFIAEGEKDVDNLRGLGVVATCNPGGALKWKANYSASLKGRHCVVLPDNDTAGNQHADKVIRALVGVAAGVRRLELPDLPPKGDVSDWIAAGGTKARLLALVERHGIRAEEDWRLQATLTDQGKIIANLANAYLALTRDLHWQGAFGYDEMLVGTLYRGQPLQDVDIFVIHKWLQNAGIAHLGIEAVREAVEIIANEHRFHPVRDYLDGLVWDGEERLRHWLHNCLGAEDSDYHANVGRWFLIAMVARIYRPGCKADYMPVLEGPQGILKSQACEVLAGGYFSDTLPDLGTDLVRVQMHLRGKWIIEVSELSAFKRAEASRLKAFITTKIEQYTPKYSRYEAHEPRQCLFVGTTNKHAWMLDETGGRRYWPIACGAIEIETLRRERDQLLAEAVVAFRNGDHWWPDHDFEEKHIKPVQAARYVGDAWEQQIEAWDRQKPETDANGNPLFAFEDPPHNTKRIPLRLSVEPPFYLADIAFGALGIAPGHLKKAEEMRLATVLESLGWIRARKTRHGRPWQPPL